MICGQNGGEGFLVQLLESAILRRFRTKRRDQTVKLPLHKGQAAVGQIAQVVAQVGIDA
ncbi:MAG: hypothetical protein GMKNLPBB_01399 [Myxococcota bacterium]|nr:hypothetical protein [Myxococcota bacterium]